MRTPAQNAWSTDLCDCCAEPSGCGFCLYAWCCQPCAYGTNVELMEPAVCCGGDCCGACMSYCGMGFLGVPCILHLMARGYLRNKYNIPGNGCSDFMTTWCCSACALCQEHRELLIRGHSKGGVLQGGQQVQNPQVVPQQQVMMLPAPNPAYPPPQPQPGIPQPGPHAVPTAPPQPVGYYPAVPQYGAPADAMPAKV